MAPLSQLLNIYNIHFVGHALYDMGAVLKITIKYSNFKDFAP